jgi:radical SAM superfamily enzyme YgiQ (UPF0313 family)
MRELAKEKLRWFTEADVNVARDDELLRLMRDSGCQQVLIGLESPPVLRSSTAEGGRRASLDGVELKSNWKLGQQVFYKEAIAKIQSYGITVNGCFILGLDRQTPAIFEQVLAFALEAPLYEVQITVLTPFPGTPLYTRLLREGRILEPGRWDLCTLFDVNFVPKNMTVEQLREGMYWLAERLYNENSLLTRRRPFFDELWRQAAQTPQSKPAGEYSNLRDS